MFAFVLSDLRTLLRELDQRVRERTAALQREVAERQRLDQEIAEVARRERLRLGQDLHDSLCQHLTGTALTAQVLREKLAQRSAPEVVEAEKVVRYIEQGIDLTRNLARGFFSPELEAEGLMVALHGLAKIPPNGSRSRASLKAPTASACASTTQRWRLNCIESHRRRSQTPLSMLPRGESIFASPG